MAKTNETLNLEQQIYRTTHKMGVFGCFEVTIGWFGKERVDYMTYDTKGIFRCFEIKVSKSDFNSKAKLSFVGHYNYYVMPQELYEQVKDEIPSHIGVYVGTAYRVFSLIKKAKKQELQVDEQILKDSMIRSLSRYLDEQLENNDENYVKLLKRDLQRAQRESEKYYKETIDLKKILFKKFGSRYMRVIEEMEDKYM